jgi:iron complex outermembrane receptor protein
VDDLQGGTDLGSLGNVPAAQSRGIELEYVVLPASFVRFFGNVSFLDAEIEDFPNGPCYPGQTPTKGCMNGVQDLAGATLPNAPDFSFDVNVEFNYPLEQIDSELFAFISYFYQDDVQFFLQNNPATVQEAYGVLDFNAGLTVRERYEASIFVSNVLDKDYATLVGVNDLGGLLVEPGVFHQLALDRRFGGRLRVTF